MIEMRKTRFGLLPIDIASFLEARDEQRKKANDQADRIIVAERARELGLDPAEVLKIDPDEAIKITFERKRQAIGLTVLNQMFPCRTCVKAHDEKYKEKCAKRGKTPCFLKAGMKGCVLYKEKPVVG